jgi:hypothetical protein
MLHNENCSTFKIAAYHDFAKVERFLTFPLCAASQLHADTVLVLHSQGQEITCRSLQFCTQQKPTLLVSERSVRSPA